MEPVQDLEARLSWCCPLPSSIDAEDPAAGGSTSRGRPGASSGHERATTSFALSCGHYPDTDLVRRVGKSL